jgi:carbonic anhydrase
MISKVIRYAAAVASLVLFMASGACAEDNRRSPDAVLARLKAGNQRYMSGVSKHGRIDAERRLETAQNGQKPFATVLGCSDSRVPVEVVFDQGFADLFVVRVAGNVCDTAELASVEYGVAYLGTTIVVVLGHTQCGAVEGALAGKPLEGSLPKLIAMITPAVEKAKHDHPSWSKSALLNEAIADNVVLQMKTMITHSPLTRDRVNKGQLKIAGAIRDIKTGKISWLTAWGPKDIADLK